MMICKYKGKSVSFFEEDVFYTVHDEGEDHSLIVLVREGVQYTVLVDGDVMDMMPSIMMGREVAAYNNGCGGGCSCGESETDPTDDGDPPTGMLS